PWLGKACGRHVDEPSYTDVRFVPKADSCSAAISSLFDRHEHAAVDEHANADPAYRPGTGLVNRIRSVIGLGLLMALDGARKQKRYFRDQRAVAATRQGRL